MMIIIVTVAITGGYLAGRLHGKAAHHRFLARGFRIMAAAARRDGVHEMSIYDLAARPVDVSNAFGKQEDIDFRVLGILSASDALAAKVADAWDEGAKAAGGYGHEDGWTHDMNPYLDNPYRAALTEGTEGA